MTQLWVQREYSEQMLPGTVYKFYVRLIFARFMTVSDSKKTFSPDETNT